MSESELLFSFLVGLIIVALGTVVLSVLQWRRVNQELRVKKRMRQLRGKKLPSVTVLVYAYNRQGEILRTLRSLKNNRYRAADIVVVDDASSDQTVELVRQFCLKYSKASIQLLKRRKRTTPQQALQAGYRKSKRGEIVLVVTAGTVVDAQFVKRSVARKGGQAQWRTSLQRELDPQLRISDIGAFLEKYFWQQEEHSYAYEASYFTRHRPGTRVIAYVPIVKTALSLGVLALLLVAAFFAVGVQLLWYGWIIVTAYGLVAIWLRYGASLRERLVLTLSIPLALFLVPVTSAMRGISQLYSRK